MTLFLAGVRDAEEARAACSGGADVLDVAGAPSATFGLSDMSADLERFANLDTRAPGALTASLTDPTCSAGVKPLAECLRYGEAFGFRQLPFPP